MRVTINGEAAEVASGSVKDCLEARGLNPDVVVVERNGVIVPAQEFATVQLEENDVLEILHFVGGG